MRARPTHTRTRRATVNAAPAGRRSDTSRSIAHLLPLALFWRRTKGEDCLFTYTRIECFDAAHGIETRTRVAVAPGGVRLARRMPAGEGAVRQCTVAGLALQDAAPSAVSDMSSCAQNARRAGTAVRAEGHPPLLHRPPCTAQGPCGDPWPARPSTLPAGDGASRP